MRACVAGEPQHRLSKERTVPPPRFVLIVWCGDSCIQLQIMGLGVSTKKNSKGHEEDNADSVQGRGKPCAVQTSGSCRGAVLRCDFQFTILKILPRQLIENTLLFFFPGEGRKPKECVPILQMYVHIYIFAGVQRINRGKSVSNPLPSARQQQSGYNSFH